MYLKHYIIKVGNVNKIGRIVIFDVCVILFISLISLISLIDMNVVQIKKIQFRKSCRLKNKMLDINKRIKI